MNINYQSDFKIIERLMPEAPFRFTYYVGKDKGSVTAEYDGQSYSGCFVDGERLIVPVDGGTLGIGNVRVKREYFLDDKAFADGVCNLVSVEGTDIELGRGRTDSDIEADVEVGVYYKAFTFDDMTEEQKQEIADRVPTKEAEREKAEAQRAEAEKGRAAAEAARQTTFDTNEEARQSVFDANEEKREEAEAKREERIDEAIASIANKVDRTDNAPELTAGFANNLVGRGEATSEEIGFRPAGGDTSIEDGTARIERLKGNTVVWNQRRRDVQIGEDRDGIKTSYDPTTGLITIENVSRDTAYSSGSTQILLGYIPDGHEVYVSADKIETGVVVTDLSAYVGVGKIGVLNGSKGIYLRITYAYDFVTKHPIGNKFTLRMNLYDLTQMFGAGNEPATIEEFNARKPMGVDEYAYNEGELISTTADEIKSVGFNAWDEEWENGGLWPVNGVERPNDTLIRTKNYIQILPSTIYYCFNGNIEGGDAMWAMFFDGQKRLIEGYKTGRRTSDNAHDILNHSFTTPATARYMRFYTKSKVYNHDICIHLAHTGYRNGEYEPYKEFRRNIPIKDIKDNDGNQLFPNGLLSAGSGYDEVTATKAIKRVNKVVLDGSESWSLQSINSYGIANFSTLVQPFGNKSWAISNKLPSQTSAIADTTSEGLHLSASDIIFLRLKTITASTVEQLRTWLSLNHITIQYASAETIEVDLPEPLNLDYEVCDFGTEEVLSSEPTTPMKADIIYQFNAVDRIRDNSRHTAEADKKLKDYETRISALEAIVASLTSSEL